MQTKTFQAGVGTRVLNFLVDTFIISVLAILLYKYWNFHVRWYHYTYHNFWVMFSVVLFIYYTFLEFLWGRTLGKWFSFTKVVDEDGKRPSIIKIFIRSATRLIPIDLFFIAFIGKPLHDYTSKTTLAEV